jgi:hypothetical protein
VVVEGEDTVKATACGPCRSATGRTAPPVRSKHQKLDVFYSGVNDNAPTKERTSGT